MVWVVETTNMKLRSMFLIMVCLCHLSIALHKCYKYKCYGRNFYQLHYVMCDQSVYSCMVSDGTSVNLAKGRAYCGNNTDVGVQEYIWCNDDHRCEYEFDEPTCTKIPDPPSISSGFTSTIVIVIIVAIVCVVIGIVVRYCREAAMDAQANGLNTPSSLPQRSYHLAAPNDNMTPGSRALTPTSYARSPSNRSRRSALELCEDEQRYYDEQASVYARPFDNDPMIYARPMRSSISSIEDLHPTAPDPELSEVKPPTVTFDTPVNPDLPPPTYESLFTDKE